MGSSVSEPVMSALGFISGLSTDVSVDPRTVTWPDGTPVEGGGAIDPDEESRLHAYGKAADIRFFDYVFRLGEHPTCSVFCIMQPVMYTRCNLPYAISCGGGGDSSVSPSVPPCSEEK